MSGEPIALSLTPAKQQWHGHPVTVKITDIGTMRLRVNTATVILHAHCQQAGTNAVSVTPSTFTLYPGQTVTAHITVIDPPGDYGATFQGIPLTAHTGGIATGAIGSQVLAGGVKSCVPVVHVRTAPKASPQVSQGSLPLVWVIIPALIVVALFIAWGAILRHRHKTGAI